MDRDGPRRASETGQEEGHAAGYGSGRRDPTRGVQSQPQHGGGVQQRYQPRWAGRVSRRSRSTWPHPTCLGAESRVKLSRAEQNKRAQQAFRRRREERMKDLEHAVATIPSLQSRLHDAEGKLKENSLVGSREGYVAVHRFQLTPVPRGFHYRGVCAPSPARQPLALFRHLDPETRRDACPPPIRRPGGRGESAGRPRRGV